MVNKMKQLIIGLISGNADDQCIESNYNTLVKVVNSLETLDILCTGELFLMKDIQVLESVEIWTALEDVLKRIQALAVNKNTALCVGYPHKSSSGIRIRQSVYFPAGEPFHYDKVHLGKKEQIYFRPGDQIETFTHKGFCIGIQICIDTHVQEMTLMQKLQGAEIILAPFNTPYGSEKRMANWKKYIPARSYEYNLCYACTNTGSGILATDGHGQIICQSIEDIDLEVITIEEDKDFNKKIDYMTYRRPEVYRY
jgi:predicted amidohydrolase